MAVFLYFLPFLVISFCLQPTVNVLCRKITETEIRSYREKVQQMFYHAYDNYMKNAYPYDELRPLSCDGVDTWGSFSLTLIDALDTLAVMGNYSEFRRVAQLLVDSAKFDMNINVSVFETNIRVVGGLLSAHLLSHRAGMPFEAGWPCSGPLLRLAEDLGRRLLPAFDTTTGMPYGTVNLRYGVPPGETPVTCTAGVATFIVEFGTLSRLTGDPSFENAALKALDSLWHARSRINLVGNHIDVMTGKWTAVDSGIGAGVDSYYEYLVKGSILLQKPELMSMFNEYRLAIQRYMVRDDWYMWVNMQKGQVTFPIFQSLEAYWPGLLALVGDISAALKTVHNYHQVWKQFGFTPEFYNIPQSEPNNNREGYPLRPELVESLMYLYKATKDPLLLQMGMDILESIQHSARTPCGYATIKDVRNHLIEDRMESFFLAETTKYLYLLFDPENFLHGNGSVGNIIETSHGECLIDAGGYIFNTEAHPLDMASVYCCGAAKEEDAMLQRFHDNMDLLSLLGLDEDSFLKPFRKAEKERRKRAKELLFAGKGVDDGDDVILSAKLQSILSIKVVENDSDQHKAHSDLDGKGKSDSDQVSDLSDQANESQVQSELSSIIEASQSSTNSYSQPQGPEINVHVSSRPLWDLKSEEDSDLKESVYTAVDPAISQISGSLAQSVAENQQHTDDIAEGSVTKNDVVTKGIGHALFLGDIPVDPVEQGTDVQEECTNDVLKDSPTSGNGDDSDADVLKRTMWAGTKPIMSSVQRDTLYSSGLSGVAGISLLGLERNNTVTVKREQIPARFEVLSCPAQPFELRFSIFGEMFEGN